MTEVSKPTNTIGNIIGNINTGNKMAFPWACAMIAATMVLADAKPMMDDDIESNAYHPDEISIGKKSKKSKKVIPLRKTPTIILKINFP